MSRASKAGVIELQAELTRELDVLPSPLAKGSFKSSVPMTVP